MLANMSRPPSLPSHSGPPHSFYSYGNPPNLQSRPEVITSSQPPRSRDPITSQNHARQLPSLRTLLEPELLDKKTAEQLPQSGTASRGSQGEYARFGSSSPTLKRRHDFEGHPHGYAEHNAIASQTSYINRPPLPTTNTDTQSAVASTNASVFGNPQFGVQRHESFAYPPQHELVDKSYRPTYAPPESSGAIPGHLLQDDIGDAGRPVRRRLDGTSRAPIRSSRCVGQREVPGEGLCYIYEDGTYCRAIIDGEPVNPSWGITKAGKPRKRLAQACLTCREKKIKCEPGYPKCHQCTKSQRICRGGLNQPGMSNASGETSPSSSVPLFKNPSSDVLSSTAGSEKHRAPGELRDITKRADPWNTGLHIKTRHFRPSSVPTSRDMSVQSFDSDWSGSGHDQGLEESRRGQYQDQLASQWEQDPFETDPRLTLHLLDLYFLNASGATCGIFPRRPFLAWVEGDREKSLDHLMLLYSMLAVGSLFSHDPDKKSLGKRFTAVASYAAEKRFGKFSLQLCQSRLMLALYHFTKGKTQEAWDFCGAGLRAIAGLKLNTEEGIRELTDISLTLDYHFDRRTFEECCRRTFWSGFLMERYNGFFGGSLFVMSLDDAFVRLPCPDDMYEASTPCEAPFPDERLWNRQASHHRSLGHMAYLCIISALWGDVLTSTERAVRRPEHVYAQHYDSFYSIIYEKLQSWKSILPRDLQYSPQNLDSSVAQGYADIFISLHSLYSATIIRLNRHVRLRAMSVENVRRNVDQCLHEASNFLSMMHGLAASFQQHRLTSNFASKVFFTSPFPSYAMLLSIDVLTAAGTFSLLPNLIETIGATTTCYEEPGDIWLSTKPHQKAVMFRLQQLQDIAVNESQGVRNGSNGQFWRITESLETVFRNDDAIYKAEDQFLFDIVGQFGRR